MTSVTSRLGSKPFLSYEPISFSLTDGTSIPPPPPSAFAAATSPMTPTQKPVYTIRRKEIPRRQDSANNPSSPDTTNSSSSVTPIGGPLSSHPITPVTSHNQEATSYFGHTTSGTDSVGAEPRSSNGYGHATTDSEDSNNFDPALSAYQPMKDSGRRPSFVARFMRLRSSSFMRSKSTLGKYSDSTSASVTSLSRSTATGQNGSAYDETERGVKRPGSPSGSSTFPRMIRRKSMDLLNTAKRKSGIWGRADETGTDERKEEGSRGRTRGNSTLRQFQSAIDEERAREQAREEYMRSFELDKQKLRVQSGDYSHLRDMTPPPSVEVQIGGADKLDGEDMFKNIGK